jgi:hypothetical protein
MARKVVHSTPITGFPRLPAEAAQRHTPSPGIEVPDSAGLKRARP